MMLHPQKGVKLRKTDPTVLVHSTTLESWNQIQKDGKLRAPSELKSHDFCITEIGRQTLLEPADYSDYVMLDIPDGCGELVVSSRQQKIVCTDPDIPYLPGVRLYFDGIKLFENGMIMRDGFHPAKVYHSLLLAPYLLCAVTADHFPQQQWTPSSFTKAANTWFTAHFSK